MHVIPLPGQSSSRSRSSLAEVAAVAARGIPLVIVAVALVPAFIVCPFLSSAHRRFVLHLLASLRQWVAVTASLRETAPGVTGSPLNRE